MDTRKTCQAPDARVVGERGGWTVEGESSRDGDMVRLGPGPTPYTPPPPVRARGQTLCASLEKLGPRLRPPACTHTDGAVWSVTKSVTVRTQPRHTLRKQMQSHRWPRFVELSSESSCFGGVGEPFTFSFEGSRKPFQVRSMKLRPQVRIQHQRIVRGQRQTSP